METHLSRHPEHHNKPELSFEEFKKVVARLTAKKHGLHFVESLGPFNEEAIRGWYDSGATPYMVVSEND